MQQERVESTVISHAAVLSAGDAWAGWTIALDSLQLMRHRFLDGTFFLGVTFVDPTRCTAEFLWMKFGLFLKDSRYPRSRTHCQKSMFSIGNFGNSGKKNTCTWRVPRRKVAPADLQSGRCPHMTLPAGLGYSMMFHKKSESLVPKLISPTLKRHFMLCHLW